MSQRLILKRPEGKTPEFKRDLSSPDGALQAIVAFANTSVAERRVGVRFDGGALRGDLRTDVVDLSTPATSELRRTARRSEAPQSARIDHCDA